MTAADTSITITGATGTATATIPKLDGTATDKEALGKVLEAINAKSADTGVTAFLEENTLHFRAVAKDGAAAAVTVTGIPATTVTMTELAAADRKGLDKVDITTQKGAWEALQRIDNAINKVNSARGDLGAIQTRFEKTVENIDIQNENLTAARGRIIDADFASETANLSRSQILQQAGTAMVAQANQLPQQVLSLLK